MFTLPPKLTESFSHPIPPRDFPCAGNSQKSVEERKYARGVRENGVSENEKSIFARDTHIFLLFARLPFSSSVVQSTQKSQAKFTLNFRLFCRSTAAVSLTMRGRHNTVSTYFADSKKTKSRSRFPEHTCPFAAKVSKLFFGRQW